MIRIFFIGYSGTLLVTESEAPSLNPVSLAAYP